MTDCCDKLARHSVLERVGRVGTSGTAEPAEFGLCTMLTTETALVSTPLLDRLCTDGPDGVAENLATWSAISGEMGLGDTNGLPAAFVSLDLLSILILRFLSGEKMNEV